jgi:rubrerythrin
MEICTRGKSFPGALRLPAARHSSAQAMRRRWNVARARGSRTRESLSGGFARPRGVRIPRSAYRGDADVLVGTARAPVSGESTPEEETAMGKKAETNANLTDLLYQALETEQGGIQVYTTAIECAINDDLKEEWEKYLEQTRHHEQVLLGVFTTLGLDPEVRMPSRDIVGAIGASLVQAMRAALENGTPEQAELVACECVVLAETKDHSNWELLEHVAKHTKGLVGSTLKAAVEEVEDEEDKHLYHTKGWCRELWIQSLGFPAALPPPEEVKEVETAIGAARAEKARDEYL